VVEAHPVRIVERGRTGEVLDQLVEVGEVQRRDFNLRAEGIRPVRVRPSEGSHTLATRQQLAGDVLAAITEGTGDGVERRHRQTV